MSFFHYWPQILMFFMMVADVVIAMTKEGEPVATTWRFKTAAVTVSSTWFLLYSGGFFTEMHWPQFLTVGTFILSLLVGLWLDGEPRTDKHEVGPTIVAKLILGLVLWQGGFWN